MSAATRETLANVSLAADSSSTKTSRLLPRAASELGLVGEAVGEVEGSQRLVGLRVHPPRAVALDGTGEEAAQPLVPARRGVVPGSAQQRVPVGGQRGPRPVGEHLVGVVDHLVGLDVVAEVGQVRAEVAEAERASPEPPRFGGRRTVLVAGDEAVGDVTQVVAELGTSGRVGQQRGVGQQQRGAGNHRLVMSPPVGADVHLRGQVGRECVLHPVADGVVVLAEQEVANRQQLGFDLRVASDVEVHAVRQSERGQVEDLLVRQGVDRRAGLIQEPEVPAVDRVLRLRLDPVDPCPGVAEVALLAGEHEREGVPVHLARQGRQPAVRVVSCGRENSPSRPRNEGKLPTGVPSADGMSQ